MSHDPLNSNSSSSPGMSNYVQETWEGREEEGTGGWGGGVAVTRWANYKGKAVEVGLLPPAHRCRIFPQHCLQEPNQSKWYLYQRWLRFPKYYTA